MATIQYDPLPYQEEFQHSVKPNVYLSAGYGAGKTYSLCMKMFELMDVNPKVRGGLLAPTYKMFKRDVLPTIREICDENDIFYDYHPPDHVFWFPDTGTELFVFHAEDNGASIRGPNLGFGLINEVSLCSKEAFDAFLARIRDKKAKRRQLAMSGTPESFNWAYEYFVENPRSDTDLIFGDMRLNTHIADDYAKRLMESYDAKMIQQYVEGKFVNLAGNHAAWMFDRRKHVKECKRDNDLPVWVSVDFNVYPMTAVLWNKYSNREDVWLKAFDEIFIEGQSDTWELADTIWERLGGKSDEIEIVLFPDPAGKARTTKGRGISDMSILRDSGFTELRYRTKIHSVRDCLNAYNALLAKGRILIDPKCKQFIADNERCIIKPGGTEIDKSDQKRGHLLDGAKNMAEYEFAINAKRESFSQYRIR